MSILGFISALLAKSWYDIVFDKKETPSYEPEPRPLPENGNYVTHYEYQNGVVNCVLDVNAAYKYWACELINGYSKTTEGELVMELRDDRISSDINVVNIKSPRSGIFVPQLTHREELYKGCTLFSVYENEETLRELRFPNVVTLEKDDFDGGFKIVGKKIANTDIDLDLPYLGVRIEYRNRRHQMLISYNPRDISISRNSVLRFLMNDGSVMTFSRLSSPIQSYRYDRSKMICINLSDTEVENLANKLFVKWQLKNSHGVVVKECDNNCIGKYAARNLLSVSQRIFQDYVIQYNSLYKKMKGV